MSEEKHNSAFLDLVLETLNLRYEISLVHKVIVNPRAGKEVEFDFADRKKLTFVKILESAKTAERSKIEETIKVATNAIIGSANSLLVSFVLIIVFEENIENREREFLSKRIGSNNRYKFEFLDRNDILNFAKSFELKVVPNIEYSEEYSSIKVDEESKTNLIKSTSVDDELIKRLSNLVLFEEQTSFWWINASPMFFDEKVALIDSVYKYPILNKNQKPKPNFGRLKKGDLLIGYDTKEQNEIYGLLVVVKKTLEEVYLKVIYLFDFKLKWSRVKELNSFKGTSFIKSNASLSLNTLSTIQFVEAVTNAMDNVDSLIGIINSSDILVYRDKRVITFEDVRVEKIIEDSYQESTSILNNDSADGGDYLVIENSNQASISILNNDSADGEDYLGIEDDVDAFAKVIASKVLAPPLSIALFGNWGSGKSFFMNKLRSRIEDYSSEAEENPFCQNIIHIHFNAWSYLDANLWASFGTIIFESIFHFIERTDQTKNEKAKVYNELTEKLLLVQEYKNELNLDLELAEEKKNEINKEIESQIAKLAEIKEKASKFSIIHFKEEIIKELEIKSSITAEIEKAGLKDTLAISSKAFENLELLSSEIKEFRYSVRSLFTSKFTIILVFVLIVALIGVSFIPVLLGFLGLDEISSLFPQFITTVFFVIIPLIYRFLYVSNKVTPIIQKVNQLIFSSEKLLNEKIEEAQVEIDKNRTLQKELERDLKILADKMFRTEQKIQSIQQKLDMDLNYETFKSIIKERHLSEAYKKHLGIISLLRTDFQLLSDLFTKDFDSQTENFNEKRIDRIVLYIDDLDRCNETRVVEVLEAVNLLLAFPLFVVVVGVDQKWVKNALTAKYHRQFTTRVNDKDYEKIEVSDYLEKIFQVPFHLKPATESSVKFMISELIKKDESLEKQNVKRNDSSPLLDRKQNLSKKEIKSVLSSINSIESIDVQESYNQFLQLDDFEIEQMPEFEFLLGNNPRTIKRFVNIYRIVRAHEKLPFPIDRQKNHLMTMFFVSLSIGHFKSSFIDILRSCQNQYMFLGSLGEFLLVGNSEKQVIRVGLEQDENLKSLLDINFSKFKELVLFIARFSFNRLNTLDQKEELKEAKSETN